MMIDLTALAVSSQARHLPQAAPEPRCDAEIPFPKKVPRRVLLLDGALCRSERHQMRETLRPGKLNAA